MNKLLYANMSKELLGEELYLKLLTELSKNYESSDMVQYGREVIDKCCLLILTLGMSKVHLENVKLYLEDGIVNVSCKEFIDKFELYTDKVKDKIIKKIEM